MDVIVVGAGIGGLTTALALGQSGIDVRVFESARQIDALGVGINLLPHAVKGLASLRCLPSLNDVGVPTQELVYYDPLGNELWWEPRGLAAGYRWPQFSIHRGELQRLLFQAVCGLLGQQAVEVGCRFVRADTEGDGSVTVHFDDRLRNSERIESCDCLIGADGIHSAVRAQFYSGEGAPQWNGILQCRGVTESVPFLTGCSYVAIGNPDQLFVAYPISRQHEIRGASLINWIAGFKIDQSGGFPPEEWNREGNAARILPHFEGWTPPCFDLTALIRSASSIFEFPQVDREPITRWSFGPITLLGDAAHPMSPNGSNGASQAILDALELRDALTRHRNIDAALQDYDQKRRPATAQVVLANRQFGMQQVARIVAKYAGTGAASTLVNAEIDRLMRDYRKIAGFDVESVNDVPQC